jgi:hypothetical protein
MFMKTFEEKWTAWLDGQLIGRELTEFEASLPDRAAAEDEKRGAHQLGALLKQELSVPLLTNADFFSHQLRERLSREEPADAEPERSTSWWTLPRLAWCGATALAMFVLFTVVAVRDHAPSDQSGYLSQILRARVDPATNPGASISMFESKDNNVTVLWTEGLQSLPAEYATK